MRKFFTLLIILFWGMVSFSQTTYDGYYNKALNSLINNQLGEAMADINTAIKLNPNVADAYYVRGNIYQKLESYTYALSDYKKTIELNPRHVDAIMKCGILYGKNNNRNMACKYFNMACELGDSKACSGYYKFCK